MKENSKTGKIFQAAMFGLTVGLLVYFCVSGNNLAILLQSLPTLNFFWLLCAVGCIVLNWLMDGEIVQLLIGHAGGSHYSFRSAFKITMVGQYFNSVTPYAVGGQPAQLVALLGQGISSGIALSALVRKFLIYQTSLSLFSLAVILLRYSFFRSQIQGFMTLAFVGFLYQAGIVVLLLLFTYCPKFTTKLLEGVLWLLTVLHIVRKPEETRSRVENQLRFYLENNKTMKGDPRLSARAFGCTLLQLLALFSIPFFIYKAFHGTGASAANMIAAQCFVTMISAYTPLPGAAGAAEGSFLVIFKLFFSESIITQAMLLWRLIAYYSCVIVGAVFVVFGSGREKMRRERKSADAVRNSGEQHG